MGLLSPSHQRVRVWSTVSVGRTSWEASAAVLLYYTSETTTAQNCVIVKSALAQAIMILGSVGLCKVCCGAKMHSSSYEDPCEQYWLQQSSCTDFIKNLSFFFCLFLLYMITDNAVSMPTNLCFVWYQIVHECTILYTRLQLNAFLASIRYSIVHYCRSSEYTIHEIWLASSLAFQASPDSRSEFKPSPLSHPTPSRSRHLCRCGWVAARGPGRATMAPTTGDQPGLVAGRGARVCDPGPHCPSWHQRPARATDLEHARLRRPSSRRPARSPRGDCSDACMHSISVTATAIASLFGAVY